MEKEDKALAVSRLDFHVKVKTAEFAHLHTLITKEKINTAIQEVVKGVQESPTKHLVVPSLPPGTAPATQPTHPLITPTPVSPESTALGGTHETEWADSLLEFVARAIALGHAGVQRELLNKLRKTKISAEKKDQAKMDLDAPSSSTVQAMITKGIADALKSAGLTKTNKGQGSRRPRPTESISPVYRKRKIGANSDASPPPRKKHQATRQENLAKEPQRGLQSKEWERRTKEGQGPEWEEVREFRRQVRNLKLKGDSSGIPDMYLDMSEQAQLIYSVGETKENELMGIAFRSIFKEPNTIMPHSVERFLSLNGKFVLHPRAPIDDLSLCESWANVESTVHWSFFFRNKKSTGNFIRQLHIQSDALLPDNPDEIQQGLDRAREELLRQAAISRSKFSEGLNPEVSAVRLFLIENNIVVKPTDKNLGLAAFSKKTYTRNLIQHINDGPYEQIANAPTPEIFHQHLLKALPRKGLTSQEERFIREPRKVDWPQFHIIPKVHKEPWGWRPIVPAHSSPTTRLSKVADLALSKILPRYPHLIRSTAEWVKAFHQGLEKRNPFRQTCLVTGDVVAFYTNIDTNRIHSSMEALLRGSGITAERANAIALLFELVTHQNFFQVDEYIFRQTQGLAMGSPCSGTIANLAMARKEKTLIKREGLLAYVRYIDDIFALVEARSETEVRHILREIDNAVKPLEIKWNVSKKHAIYLDVDIRLRTGISLTAPDFQYSAYRKPGSQRAYLPWSSAHPIHVKKGLVIGETTRLALLSSEEDLFIQEVASFSEQLQRRGYPLKAVKAWTRRVP